MTATVLFTHLPLANSAIKKMKMRPTTTLYSFPVLLINAGLVATPKQPGNQRYMYTSAAAGMTTMVVGFAAWTAATLEAQGFDTLFALVPRARRNATKDQ